MAQGMTDGQVLGLVLASMLAGAALLLILLGWISSRFGEECGAGCMSLGWVLLLLAGFVAVRLVLLA